MNRPKVRHQSGERISRRDALIKVVAKAHSPDALDLTKYRQRSNADGDVIRVRRTDVLGAQAYASMDWEQRDKQGFITDAGEGNPLNQVLMTLKYVSPLDRKAFDRAHLLLMLRHVKRDRKRPSDTMFAVASTALFEWVFDGCTACRGKKPKTLKPRLCHACPPPVAPRERDTPRHFEVETLRKGLKLARTNRPKPGCKYCGGVGRIFSKPANPRGMLCGKCGNTGRSNWTQKARWICVNDLLCHLEKRRAVTFEFQQMALRKRGLKEITSRKPQVAGIAYEIFSNRWSSKYRKFLDVLRQADKDMTLPLDVQLTRAENRNIVRGPEEENHMLPDEPATCPTAGKFPVAGGELPP